MGTKLRSASHRGGKARPLDRLLLGHRYREAVGGQRHWLTVHLTAGAPTRFGNQLLDALADCEMASPGIGAALTDGLAAIRYVPHAVDPKAWQAGFEQLIQKFAEILVLRVLLVADWPNGTRFAFEPANPTTGSKPELAIDTARGLYLFEVKCPSMIDHQARRRANSSQLPVRSPLGASPDMRGDVTLPRDHVFKEFLESAQSKFANFSKKPTTALLIVLWNAHMYEAIAVLTHEQAGLLTAGSWHVRDGQRVAFDAVDGVIVLNHHGILVAAAQERPARRQDPFLLGGEGQPPNVWCPNLGRADLEPFLANTFDAWPAEAAAIAAEYAPMEFVMWFGR